MKIKLSTGTKTKVEHISLRKRKSIDPLSKTAGNSFESYTCMLDYLFLVTLKPIKFILRHALSSLSKETFFELEISRKYFFLPAADFILPVLNSQEV